MKRNIKNPRWWGVLPYFTLITPIALFFGAIFLLAGMLVWIGEKIENRSYAVDYWFGKVFKTREVLKWVQQGKASRSE